MIRRKTLDSSIMRDFSKKLLRVMKATGLGQLVSSSTKDDVDTLVIDIGPMEIPQYPINSVKKIEQITVAVIDHDLPIVFCRDDFPIVPHLNMLPDGKKTLCLFDVPFKELEYTFNASVFLNRIIRWFELTARGELHQSNQPLEPFFPSCHDGIILNLENKIPFVRLKQIALPDRILYQEIPLEDTSSGKVYAVLVADIQKTYSDNIIHDFPKTLGNLDSTFNESIVDLLDRVIPAIWTVKQSPQYYKLLFQQTETLLKKCAVILIVRVALARSKEAEQEQHHLKVFQIAHTFQEIYQAFGYKKNGKGKLLKQGSSLDYQSIPVYPFEVFGAFDRKFAKALSSRTLSCEDDQFVQIGLGALGSQIANNCIRSAYGKWTYIDPDILLPHNLARHSLDQRSIGQFKVNAIKEFADNMLFDQDSMIPTVITADIFNKSHYEKYIAAIENASLLVDCSASVAVERHLVNKLLRNTRAMSFFMNPSGTSLIMLLEDSKRCVTLDVLEMQYYRMLIQNESLNDHLKSKDKVLYATTCRGSSLVYPQEHAAIFSGICTKAIKNANTSTESKVCVWNLNDLAIDKYEEYGEEFQAIKCDDWSILVSSSLARRLHEVRNQKLPNETGGVLIGTYDFANNICYIVDAIDSPSDSEEYPNAYIRGSNGLLEKVQRIEEITIGNLTYIGEWHSHPNDSTSPSSNDRILLKSIAEYAFTQSAPGCMMIVGESHVAVYLEFI